MEATTLTESSRNGQGNPDLGTCPRETAPTRARCLGDWQFRFIPILQFRLLQLLGAGTLRFRAAAGLLECTGGSCLPSPRLSLGCVPTEGANLLFRVSWVEHLNSPGKPH